VTKAVNFDAYLLRVRLLALWLQGRGNGVGFTLESIAGLLCGGLLRVRLTNKHSQSPNIVTARKKADLESSAGLVTEILAYVIGHD
jgi:hypothetical protein